MKYILAIDQGTTGTTACLIDADNFNFIRKANREHPQIYPRPSWVEHNLNDIWASLELTVIDVMKNNNVTGEQITAIGITNQRETTCAFRKDGTPLTNAIVWQDRRTSDFCSELREKKYEEMILEKTGLKVDPYFSGSKMHWLLTNNVAVKDAAAKKNLCLGNIDTYLLYRLTNGASFKTDASNASRTMLMSLKSCDWDNDLLHLFGLDKSMLPTIEDSFGEFGRTQGLSFLPDGIPITGILGDQQSALFGQAGFLKGDMKCTYGTGAFVLLNTGSDIVYSRSGLLTTVQYRHQGKTIYALEGSSYIAGAAVQWLRDNLKIISKSSEVEGLAREVKNLSELENILFFPFFTGIGSPHWCAEAKAAIVGITRDTNNSHLAFAALEGIVLSINDLLTAMRKDTGLSISTLKVDGGAVENNLLMELQATYSETKIIRPKIIETTAFGAALAAAIGAKLVTLQELNHIWKEDRVFLPVENMKTYAQPKLHLWNQTLKKLYLS